VVEAERRKGTWSEVVLEVAVKVESGKAMLQSRLTKA
jgi:hypothetical protein